MNIESHFIPFAAGEQLHVRRFYTAPDHPALLLIHGSIENGKIFYSDSGKGFAPWIAQQGYDVFVVDLRGRGQSRPLIHRGSDWGQAEALAEEYPAIFKWVTDFKGSTRIYVGTHSWAGVNVLAFLARTDLKLDIPAMVFFGSKRHISVRPFPYYFLMINLGWRLLARRSVRLVGYLDAIYYRMGSDNITARDWLETDAWVKDGHNWIHWQDGFDYRKAFAKIKLPPTLYISGRKDRVLGHPKDVAALAAETGAHQPKKVVVLSRALGNRHDYGHIDMLTHPDAPRDHFPMVADWLRNPLKNA